MIKYQVQCIRVFKIIVIKAKDFDKSVYVIILIYIYIKMCINNKSSSNINEVIEAILDFFIQKFHKHKKRETLTANKNKKFS